MKIFKIMLFLFFTNLILMSKEGFFLQNRTGALIKIDVMSGFKANRPAIKGPTLNDIKDKIEKDIYEKEIFGKLDNEVDKNFFNMVYQLNEEDGFYYLNKDLIIKEFNSFLLKDNILMNIQKSEKDMIFKYYILDKKTKFYNIKSSVKEDDYLRVSQDAVKFILMIILLDLNKENEMKTGIDTEGAPMPHNFPRVFEAKSKGYIDVHFVWGYKFADIVTPENVTLGAVTLGFSLNLTNIVMPSLEIMVKYNFNLGDKYPYFEPFIGGLIYGGFIDGFPIGFNMIGGCDIFPRAGEGDINFYLSGEMRLGAVLYSKIYFDTGKNNEGIWKKFDILVESGFYFGAGYRWDKI